MKTYNGNEYKGDLTNTNTFILLTRGSHSNHLFNKGFAILISVYANELSGPE